MQLAGYILIHSQRKYVTLNILGKRFDAEKLHSLTHHPLLMLKVDREKNHALNRQTLD